MGDGANKMNFILTGFTQDEGSRVFAFQGIEADRSRLEYSARADLNLTRRYGIRLQELPLLCRALLERLPDGGEARTVTFTEQDMRLHADKCAAERDAQKRKAPRKPPAEHAATDWQASQTGHETTSPAANPSYGPEPVLPVPDQAVATPAWRREY